MNRPEITIRTLQKDEWSAVAELIRISTNHWYMTKHNLEIFVGPDDATILFPQVYEALDPGCCLVAVDHTGRLLGSCFYHPRLTHVSLGIMNVHPEAFGRRIASRLLTQVIEFADSRQLPIRLVSSAGNLDSYSLYTRQGFTPRAIYQDMILPGEPASLPEVVLNAPHTFRSATHADLAAIAALEQQVSGIERTRDYQHFLAHPEQGWQLSVAQDDKQNIVGFLASIANPGSNMLGPGVMLTEDVAAALIRFALQRRPAWTPVMLVPAQAAQLVKTLYAWGAKNLELHLLQVRGECPSIRGIVMPTFMPETG